MAEWRSDVETGELTASPANEWSVAGEKDAPRPTASEFNPSEPPEPLASQPSQWTAAEAPATDDDAGARPAGEQRLPNIALVAASFAVFDGVLALAYLVFAAIDQKVLLNLLQAAGGLSLIAAITPIIVGGVVLHRYRDRETSAPVRRWALGAIGAGITLGALTLFIPFSAALSAILGS